MAVRPSSLFLPPHPGGHRVTPVRGVDEVDVFVQLPPLIRRGWYEHRGAVAAEEERNGNVFLPSEVEGGDDTASGDEVYGFVTPSAVRDRGVPDIGYHDVPIRGHLDEAGLVAE